MHETYAKNSDDTITTTAAHAAAYWTATALVAFSMLSGCRKRRSSSW